MEKIIHDGLEIRHEELDIFLRESGIRLARPDDAPGISQVRETVPITKETATNLRSSDPNVKEKAIRKIENEGGFIYVTSENHSKWIAEDCVTHVLENPCLNTRGEFPLVGYSAVYKDPKLIDAFFKKYLKEGGRVLDEKALEWVLRNKDRIIISEEIAIQRGFKPRENMYVPAALKYVTYGDERLKDKSHIITMYVSFRQDNDPLNTQNDKSAKMTKAFGGQEFYRAHQDEYVRKTDGAVFRDFSWELALTERKKATERTGNILHAQMSKRQNALEKQRTNNRRNFLITFGTAAAAAAAITGGILLNNKDPEPELPDIQITVKNGRILAITINGKPLEPLHRITTGTEDPEKREGYIHYSGDQPSFFVSRGETVFGFSDNVYMTCHKDAHKTWLSAADGREHMKQWIMSEEGAPIRQLLLSEPNNPQPRAFIDQLDIPEGKKSHPQRMMGHDDRFAQNIIEILGIK